MTSHVEELLRIFHEEKTRVERYILTGTLSTYDEYRYQVGLLRGVEKAIKVYLELLQKK